MAFTRRTLAALAAVFAIWAFPAPAAVFTTYSNLTDFTNALGGAATQTQDFSGFPPLTDLNGVEFLPGVTATTENDSLVTFNEVMFSLSNSGRENPAYVMNIGGNYNAFAFNIAGWNPAATDPILLGILFSDSDLQVVPLNRPPGALESENQFFGIISDVPLNFIALFEPPEVNGGPGLEEVALDDFIAANVTATGVPEPATIGVSALGLGACLLLRRKKRYSGA